VLRLVSAVPIEKEIIVVDDASVDGTRDILAKWDGRDGVRVILHERNGGKGTAVATAIREAKGEILIIQDVDLEYDPSEYPIILKPIEAGRPTSFTVRGFAERENSVQFRHTSETGVTLFHVATNLNLSELATYKAFACRVFRISIWSRSGLGLTEFARRSRARVLIFEVLVGRADRWR
jgi:glycosyltransferase involved in cell wall biosynthesis